MIRRKLISINASSEAISRNTFAIEFRIYPKKKKKKEFGET